MTNWRFRVLPLHRWLLRLGVRLQRWSDTNGLLNYPFPRVTAVHYYSLLRVQCDRWRLEAQRQSAATNRAVEALTGLTKAFIAGELLG